MRVLVTGAGGGLGSASVHAFRSAEWVVLASDRAPGSWSDGEETPIIGEIGSAQWVETLASATVDGLDAVVAAHGIEGTGAIADLTEARIDQVMSANFESVRLLYEAVEGQLTATRGAFVVISSQAGLQGEPSSSAYCASKFALRAWMDARHRDSAGSIRYRTLCPGATETPLLRSAFEGMARAEGVTYEEVLSRRSAAVPVGRLGRPADIGAATLWLAELDALAHVVAPVTGGEVMR